MKLFRSLIVFAWVVPLVSAANKETIELQRDVMALQDQVRQMNDKLVALTTMVQTVLDNTRQSNISIGTMQDRVGDSLKKQEQNVVAPIANVGQKLDQMSDDFRAVRETVLDLNSRMNKLDAKITDLQNLVQVQASRQQLTPPPVQNPVPDNMNNGGSTGTVPSTARPTGPPAGMQAETSYTNAYRDYIAGSYDLALQEFTDYLKYFPSTQFAPNAQYYVGDIYFKRKDYDNAIQGFDAVLEHWSDNPKTPDAHLMKGRSLQALGKRDAAVREYKEIVSKYPDSDSAAKAKTLLKELGLSSSSSAKAKSRRKR